MSNPFKSPGGTGSADQLAFRGPLTRGGTRLPIEGMEVPPVRLPVPPARPAPVAPPPPAPRPMPAPSAQPRPLPQPLPQPQVQPQTQRQTDAPPMTREQTREGEDSCKAEDKDCVECPPEQGVMAIANAGKGHSMSDLSAQYQQWVTNFPYPHEWLWSGTWWDGFDKSRCTLLEAKANYAFMFMPILNWPKPWFDSAVQRDLIEKAFSHAEKAVPAPPVSVEWHFLQRVVYEYCSSMYKEAGKTNLFAFWNPMPGGEDAQEYEELRREEQRQMDEYYKSNPEQLA